MSSHRLLPAEQLGRLAGLELKARSIVDGYLSGMHRSPNRGFSIEFAEHRQYTPGDDLRYLDWKIYGKRDRYYLKQFEEETNFVGYVLLDVSDSMRYRWNDQGDTKLDHARVAAAALSYLILRQQDAVGLSTFSGEEQRSIKPAGQPAQLKQILAVLEAIPVATERPWPVQSGAPERDFSEELHALAERMPPRSLVLILSDFFAEPAPLEAALKHLRHRRHDVSLLQVIDPAEQDFPFEEPTLLHDLERPQAELVEPRAVRAAYQQEFESFRRTLELRARGMGIDYCLMRTDKPVHLALGAYLAARGRSVR